MGSVWKPTRCLKKQIFMRQRCSFFRAECGTLNLQAHTGLRELLLAYGKAEKYVAAICAAPSILGELGMLDGKRACCYPSFEEKLTGAEVVREPVVLDQNVITSRGMGTAIPFALKLVEVLCGMERAEEVRKSIIYNEE